MNLSLLLVLGVPAVLVLGATTMAGARVFRALSQRKVPSLSALLGLVVCLVLIDGVFSLVVVLDAALSHSEQAKHNATWICVAAFVVIVLGPCVGVGRRVRSIRASELVGLGGSPE